MTTATPYLDVLPTSEARNELSHALERFRRDGVAADLLVFGNHRRPEGVVVPFALFEALYEAIDEIRLAAVLKSRIADESPRTTLEDMASRFGYAPSDFGLD